jgi:hypothetical protein
LIEKFPLNGGQLAEPFGGFGNAETVPARAAAVAMDVEKRILLNALDETWLLQRRVQRSNRQL